MTASIVASMLTMLMIFFPLSMHRCTVPDGAVHNAITYLRGELNPDLGLLRASPVAAPNIYWLATDNRLAVYALREAGVHDLADTLEQSLYDYGDQPHGLIEALTGQTIEWPPRTAITTEVTSTVSAKIWLEQRSGDVMYDWDGYADLAFYGALHAFHNGDRFLAHHRYQAAMLLFDGRGFDDKYFQAEGLHPTYKLALALYTARVLDEPFRQDVLSALLAQQARTGGFYTLYDAGGHSIGDTSTEPTAYAILALAANDKAGRPMIHRGNWWRFGHAGTRPGRCR